jgi:hypothetical protein
MGYWQALTPDELLGRANATRRSVNRTMAALGALLAGLAVGLIGDRPTLIGAVIAFAAAALTAALSPLREAPGQNTVRLTCDTVASLDARHSGNASGTERGRADDEIRARVTSSFAAGDDRPASPGRSLEEQNERYEHGKRQGCREQGDVAGRLHRRPR